MTIHLLDCPDCRTEFRIRELSNPVPLHCPRCGEAMDITQARLQPPREKKKASASAVPARSENDRGKANPRDTSTKPTPQAKRGLQMKPVTAVAVVLCAGGAVTAAMYFGFRLALRPAAAVLTQNSQMQQGCVWTAAANGGTAAVHTQPCSREVRPGHSRYAAHAAASDRCTPR
jgi:hypothetical protein